MENATKALLIAAAVLVAILIIGLGIVVYDMASETISGVNFSGQEIKAFNDQFLQYQGQHVRGSEVNAMLKTVLNSNMKSRSEGLTAGQDSKFVRVTSGSDETVVLQVDASSINPTTMANTARLYTVTVSMDQNGFVSEINFTVETQQEPN